MAKLVKIKVGNSKYLLNKNLGLLYKGSDKKYFAKLRSSSKGVYFTKNGKRVYLPDKLAAMMLVGVRKNTGRSYVKPSKITARRRKLS